MIVKLYASEVTCLIVEANLFSFAASPSQLVLFGLSNQMVVTFKEENTAAFKYLFLKGYRDNVPQAVHTQEELYSHINFTIEQVVIVM